MEDWEKIVSTIIIGALVLFAIPRAKQLLKREAQDNEEKDWKGFLFPIAMVVVFVVILIMSVR